MKVVDYFPYFKPNYNPCPVSKIKDKCTSHNLHETTVLYKYVGMCTAHRPIVTFLSK